MKNDNFLILGHLQSEWVIMGHFSDGNKRQFRPSAARSSLQSPHRA